MDRLTATPPGIALTPIDLIPDGTARNFVIEMRAGRFHGFVVRRGETIRGYVDRCPHMSVPLTQMLDDYLTPSGNLIACNWHGALFRIEDGVCVGGPCTGQALTPWPVTLANGTITTA